MKLEDLPLELENIILDYKEQLELTEKYDNVMKELHTHIIVYFEIFSFPITIIKYKNKKVFYTFCEEHNYTKYMKYKSGDEYGIGGIIEKFRIN